MKAVADSGPFIHLALVNQSALLQRYFDQLLILPQVYDEVVTQGRNRPGAPELQTACEAALVHIVTLADLTRRERIHRSAQPAVSLIDAMVVALAVEQNVPLLSDDRPVRILAKT